MQHNITRHVYTTASALTVFFPAILLAGHVAADIALSLVAVLFLVHSYLEKDWQWLQQPWLQCVALLWIYSVIRSVFADHEDDALRRTLPFVRYFAFAAAIACWTLQEDRNRKSFLQVLIGTVLFLALDGLLQWSTGRDLLQHDMVHNVRLTGPFHAQILGIMLVWLSFPACLSLLVPGRTVMSRATLARAVGMALLVFVAIVLSGERMAMIYAFFGWGIAVCLVPTQRRIILPILLACMALFALLAYSNTTLKERQVHSTLTIMQHWEQSPYGMLFSSDLQIAQAHPVFGVGANHFRYYCPPLYAATPNIIPAACNTHPHNVYMEWLLEEGIIGFGLFIAFLLSVCRTLMRIWPGMRTDPFFVGLLIAFIFRIWPFAPSTNFFSPWGAPPFWLILGALLAYAVPPKEASPCASS